MARVRVKDVEQLRSLKSVKAGDLINACGEWHAPGVHDLQDDLVFREAARDGYRLERWNSGKAGRLEIRAVEISADDVRRYDLRDASWERLTVNWARWKDPFLHEEAGRRIAALLVAA